MFVRYLLDCYALPTSDGALGRQSFTSGFQKTTQGRGGAQRFPYISISLCAVVTLFCLTGDNDSY